MKNFVPFGLAVGVFLAAGAPVQAQTITAAGGNATFTFNPTAVPTTGTAIGGGSSNLDVNGAATGGDSLFETWWWYRVDGVDSREFRYSADTNPFVAAGDSMTGTFNFAEFRSDLGYQITDPDGASVRAARLSMRNSIVNTSAAVRTINIFSYADLDVNGELTNHYSYDFANGMFNVSDAAPTSSTAYFKGFGATRYQAALYTMTPGNGVRGLVADTDIDNLNNTVSGSPGDFTGAFQWTFTLAPGEGASILALIDLNPPPWPTPGTISIFGLAAVAANRRRRSAVGQ